MKYILLLFTLYDKLLLLFSIWDPVGQSSCTIKNKSDRLFSKEAIALTCPRQLQLRAEYVKKYLASHALIQ